MKFYAGLDISQSETAICVVDETGQIVREQKVETEPELLLSALRAHNVSFERVGLEACPLSEWLFAELTAAGLPAICVEVRRLRATLAGLINKTDKNDARGIAQVMRTGWFKAVHVKSRTSQELRFLLAARKSTLDRVQDAENELRGALKTFGLKVGSTTRRTFAARIRELVADLHILTTIVEPLLAVRAVLIEQHNRLHKLVLEQVREDTVCRRLMTVPGVGPVVALSFKTAIDAPARFARSRSVGAYLGLTPRRYQSGEIDRTGRISKIGDRAVRTALFEAASVLLTRTTRWSKLKAWAVRLAQRSGAKTAKVALARKLAVILHRVWIDGTDFQWQTAENR